MCFATVNQMFGGSSQLPTTAERAVIKSLSTVQTGKQFSVVVGTGRSRGTFDCGLSFKFQSPYVIEKRSKADTHDARNRCDRLLQQIVTNRPVRHVKIIVAAICSTNGNFFFATYRSNKISASSLVVAAVQRRRLIAAMCRCDLSHRVSQPLVLVISAKCRFLFASRS